LASPGGLTLDRVEESISLAQNLIKDWHEIYSVFENTTRDTPPDNAADRAFLNLKSAVMRRQQALFRAVFEDYPFGRYIQNLLGRLVSLDQVRSMPHSQRRIITRDWHVVFIRLWVLLGKLEQQRLGETADVPSSGSDTKRPERESGRKNTLLVAVVVIIIVAAVAGVLFYLQFGS